VDRSRRTEPRTAGTGSSAPVGFMLGPPVIGGLAQYVGLGAALALPAVLLAAVYLLSDVTSPATAAAPATGAARAPEGDRR
jgi:hypothetical protein